MTGNLYKRPDLHIQKYVGSLVPITCTNSTNAVLLFKYKKKKKRKKEEKKKKLLSDRKKTKKQAVLLAVQVTLTLAYSHLSTGLKALIHEPKDKLHPPASDCPPFGLKSKKGRLSQAMVTRQSWSPCFNLLVSAVLCGSQHV